MTVKARDAILPILVVLLLVAGCLGRGGDTPSTEAPLPPDTTAPPIYVRTTTPPPATALPTTTPPPTVTTTPPPVTTTPPTTGPPTEEQIKEKIRQDLIGRQLSTTSGAYTYAVKPDDIRTFEAEILDGMPVWKVTVVADTTTTTFPYRWLVYYTTSGTLIKTSKQF